MPDREGSTAEQQLTMRVASHVRDLIEKGALRPGDKIPAERDFARELKISRASLRTGIGYLAALGVLKVKHGVGAFVADGPAELGRSSLALLGALRGFTTPQLFEARGILEGALAALAASRGREEHLAAIDEELAEQHASEQNPAEYLIHDVRFHRAIGQAAANPILAALMETVTTALYESRRRSVERASNLKEVTEMHRKILQAIQTRDSVKARRLMDQHLKIAEAAQGLEKPRREAKAGAAAKRPAKRAGRPASSV